MEKKKRAGKRKQYLDDFRPAVNGEYVYTGNYYSQEMERPDFSRLRGFIIAAVVITAGFVLAAGLLPAAGSINCFYVILPFLAVIISCCITAWKVLSLLLSGYSVRKYIYENTVPLIPVWIKAGIISSAATLISETVFLSINGFKGRELQTVIFIFLIVLSIAGYLLVLRLIKRISWKKEDCEREVEVSKKLTSE